MDILHAFWLAVVQGMTEFLPISSSAHLVVLPKLFGWKDQGLAFDIAVHVGTLFAVMVYFRKDILAVLCGLCQLACRKYHTDNARLALHLSVATVPLLCVAPFIKDSIELYARHFIVIGTTSIGFGLLLWWADARMKSCDLKKPPAEKSHLTLKEAFIYGLFQVLAMIPGTSRSGICMTAGRLLGHSRTFSSRFSMLMAVPVIALAGLYSAFSGFKHGVTWQADPMPLLVGVGVSALTALGAIHLLMKLVEKTGFLPFVIYRCVLGILLLFLAF